MKNYKLREQLSLTERENLKLYPELLQELLFFRGITNEHEADKFLNPSYDLHTHDPYLLKDMEKAVERISAAIQNNEKTVIWGDYDADGIPGAVVLHDFFKKIGFTNFQNYIPDRNEEGFGLNEKAIGEFGKAGVKLLITIDCGIADVYEVEKASGLGIDVIITDHHIPPLELPKAYAIVNPKQEDCNYPEKMLCGGGVIFKLVQAILKKNSFGLTEGSEKWLLDMVAISTVSDMVPLVGENRVFAYYGLKVLRKSPRLGLLRLLRELKISQSNLTEDDIGFTISPRINAASRMGAPLDAFTLFSTADEVEAERLVKHLNTINDERKGVVASMVKEIKLKLDQKLAKREKKPVLIVMGNPSWRPSLVGLAAHTLLGEHGCPVFLWGREGGAVLKGSCRSKSVNLISLMQEVSPGVLSSFGGHMLSGGFSVENEKVHFLEEELERAYEKIKHTEKKQEAEWIDKKLDLDDVNFKTWSQIERLAPFGAANAKPTFLFENVKIHAVDEFGKEKNHLKLIFKKNDSGFVSAIAFFTTRDNFSVNVEAGSKVTLIAFMEKSMFRNYPELRLRIVDIV